MALVLIIAGIACFIAGLASTFTIIMDAFENELYMGLLCLVFWPYMLWYTFAEFDHEKKWLMVGLSLFGYALGGLLCGIGLTMKG